MGEDVGGRGGEEDGALEGKGQGPGSQGNTLEGASSDGTGDGTGVGTSPSFAPTGPFGPNVGRERGMDGENGDFGGSGWGWGAEPALQEQGHAATGKPPRGFDAAQQAEGKSYATLGCLTHRSRGATVCSNGRLVSEMRVREAVIAMLRRHLGSPERIAFAVEAIAARFRARDAASSDLEALDAQIAEAERRTSNARQALVALGMDSAMLAMLRQEEDKARSLKDQRSRVGKRRVLPHPGIVGGYLRQLLDSLEHDEDKGREILSRFMPPLRLTPDESRGWRISGAFGLEEFVEARGKAVLDDVSSGGALLRLSSAESLAMSTTLESRVGRK